MRNAVSGLIVFTLCVNMFGFAASHYIIKKWSKASVREYLKHHKPQETFTFRIQDEKVLDRADAILIEDHEIQVGNDMYDIISGFENSEGIKTVRCILDTEEMSLRAVCYEVFNTSSEDKLPIKKRHTSLMKTIIKDAQLPFAYSIPLYFYSIGYYAEISAEFLSIIPPVHSPPPEHIFFTA